MSELLALRVAEREDAVVEDERRNGEDIVALRGRALDVDDAHVELREGAIHLLGEALGAPVLCTLQGEAPFLDALEEPYRTECWRTLAERARRVQAFLPVSRYTGDLMRDRLTLPDDRVHVVWNGIDATGYEPAPEPPSRPTVGYLARMCRDKGIGQLFDAFLIITEGALRGAGDTRWTFYLEIVAGWGFFVPGAWYVGVHLEHGLTGAWLVGLAHVTLLAACLLQRFRSGAWQKIRI